MGSGNPKDSTINAFRCRNGLKKNITRIEPNTLNTRCARAVRLELTLVDAAAKFDVMVVPIFSPKMKATALGNVMTPVDMSNIAIVVAAAEDCRQNVIMAPIRIKISVLNVVLVKGARKVVTASLLSSGSAYPLTMLRPRNRNANPIRNEPKSLVFCFSKNDDSTNPTNISGMAIDPRLNDPSRLTANSHAVTVVPMLAPIITPMALRKDIRPAFTKLTSISVVAVDVCL